MVLRTAQRTGIRKVLVPVRILLVSHQHGLVPGFEHWVKIQPSLEIPNVPSDRVNRVNSTAGPAARDPDHWASPTHCPLTACPGPLPLAWDPRIPIEFFVLTVPKTLDLVEISVGALLSIEFY